MLTRSRKTAEGAAAAPDIIYEPRLRRGALAPHAPQGRVLSR